MIAMQKRVLDGSMNDVTLASIIDRTAPLTELHQSLYGTLKRDVYRLLLQRTAAYQRACYAVTHVTFRDIEIDYLEQELREISELVQICCPMAFIVAAGRYAESNSTVCAIAAFFYYCGNTSRLTAEQRQALQRAIIP